MQEQSESKKKIVIVVSSPLTVKYFLIHQINILSKYYLITLMVNIASDERLAGLSKNIKVLALPIEREIKLISDIKALWLLFVFFRSREVDIVHSFTPKAGLLSMVASYLAGVPIRIHTFTGQVWANRKGLPRFFLKFFDRLISAFSTHILIDSPSQKRFLLREGVVSELNSTVLGNGSICGVDTDLFRPNGAIRHEVRSRLEIDADEILILFLGRLKRDKGVLDLAQAFLCLKEKHNNISLIFVGPDEEDLHIQLANILKKHKKKVHFIYQTDSPQDYISASDILVLPSYREGFGNVLIEAAACATPTVASNIYGVIDAVSHQETGILFEAGNIDKMAQAIEELILDKELRNEYGQQALNLARQNFSQKVVTRYLLEFYQKLL